MELKVENIKLPVRDISNWREISITHIDDASYLTALGCPICEKTKTQSMIEVRTYKQRGLELHFCSNCEHIFFERYPDQAWYTAYYKEDKDVNVSVNFSYFRRFKHFIRNRPIVYDIWVKRLLARHRNAATLNAMLRVIMADANFFSEFFIFILGINALSFFPAIRVPILLYFGIRLVRELFTKFMHGFLFLFHFICLIHCCLNRSFYFFFVHEQFSH